MGSVTSAVLALWLVIPPSGSDQVWQTQPTASQVPPGSAICAWTIVNGDRNPNDYTSNGQGGTTYSPPPPPTPAQNLPNSDIAKTALLADTNLSNTVQANLTAFYPLLDYYQYNANFVQQLWSVWVAAYSGTWLTSDIQTAIIDDCGTANILLVPAQQFKPQLKKPLNLPKPNWSN